MTFAKRKKGVMIEESVKKKANVDYASRFLVTPQVDRIIMSQFQSFILPLDGGRGQ